jgi:His-Xaa-Ser system radical SAM maturase HxsC
MLELSGKLRQLSGLSTTSPPSLLRVVTTPALPKVLARDAAYLCQSAEIPAGFRIYMALESNREFLESVPSGEARAVLPDSASFLREGDIMRVSPSSGSYRVVFRSHSNHVSILLTERCNHYCLMCSQPPREVNDDWIMNEVENLLPMIPIHTREIGFTGGEPTLYGDRFIRLLECTKTHLPRTAVHVLSNGRIFSDLTFSEAYAAVKHPDLMIGIPLYSDDPVRHNYVVQADGAFDETVQGIINLKRLKQRVELRVVLHLQTIDRLTNLAEFITRNLLFVDQVALMGLEITGFTRGNLAKLWIDPYDYRDTLGRAVDILSAYKIPTAVYNHQLCVVPERVRRFCTRSISDWKNEYLPVCSSCALRGRCGGFFSSGVRYRHSDYIQPMTTG